MLLQDAKKVEIKGATVDFYQSVKDGVTYYYFDSSKCGPPEPMVNAMVGLKLVTNPNVKLIMINHQMPLGLLDKIGNNFDIEKEKLSDGKVKLVFAYKEGFREKTDLSDNSCND